MTDETPSQDYPEWMPTAGGTLSILGGSLGLIGSIFLLVFSNIIGSGVLREFFPSSAWQHWGWPLVIAGILAFFSLFIDILAILGGIFTIQRKHWGWALAGGICAIIASRILGIVALVFIALSRKEFE